VHTLARLEAPIEDIRAAALGGYLLVRSGGAVFRVSLDGETRRIDTDWTPDLPLGLPDGRVLAAADGEIAALPADGGSSREIPAAGGPAHWALVSWDPAPPVVAGRVEGVPLGERADADEPADPDETGERAGATDGARLAAGELPPPAAELIPSERLLGFYTIVASAQSYPGVLSLTQSLDAAGWPTAIQTHQDDAGVVWYRGLVGPYVNRQGAEAAARQLRRERGLQVWVTEIGTGFPAEDAVN
jgi:cell division septation protein DedD